MRPPARGTLDGVMDSLVDGVLAGDRRAIARAISMVEDGAEDLARISAGLYPHTGNAYTMGLTGAPGVGKSSLAEQLVRAARERGTRVAVLAIDPTSPFTGGALLGDRLRMQAHATDPGVFIRSMATRGHLGGMALAAPEAIRILDASGVGLVIVETVGVGQVEVEVATATDTTLVVVSPGWGDAVQVAKAGILEIADVFVVNKADRDDAKKAVTDLEQMIAMGPEQDWTPPVVATSAVSGEGIDELWAVTDRHREALRGGGRLEELRRARRLREVETLAGELLRGRLEGVLANEPQVAADLEARRIDPYQAAARLLAEATRGHQLA